MRTTVENEIEVRSDNNYLVWKIPTEGKQFAKEVTLRVGSGCNAICYVDGSPILYNEGAHKLSWRKEESRGGKITVVGINRDKQFKLLFGVGGIPFNDKEVKLSPHVGVHGECLCTLFDGGAIYKAFGESVSAVTPEDVMDKLREMFAQTLVSEFAKVLSNYNYFALYQSIDELSATVKKLFAGELAKEGIILESCSISAPNFPEGYNEERRQRVEDKDNERRSDMKRAQELGLLRELSKNAANAGANRTPETPAKIYCSRCGKENNAALKFCRFCGAALNK